MEPQTNKKIRNSKFEIRNYFTWSFLFFSAVGFADATYLVVKHFSGGPILCGDSGGCDVVTTSVYSTIFGIPVALLGALYYLTVFLLVIGYIDKKKEQLLTLASWFTWAGLVASIYFVILQLFVIGDICRYCMGSAATSTLLFITGMVYLVMQKKKKAS